MRHKFDGMANVLLSSKHMDGKLHLLQSKGYDNRTPVEIAKKNGMKRVCDQIDKLQVSHRITYTVVEKVYSLVLTCIRNSSSPLQLNQQVHSVRQEVSKMFLQVCHCIHNACAM